MNWQAVVQVLFRERCIVNWKNRLIVIAAVFGTYFAGFGTASGWHRFILWGIMLVSGFALGAVLRDYEILAKGGTGNEP